MDVIFTYPPYKTTSDEFSQKKPSDGDFTEPFFTLRLLGFGL
jgi:hypothetical protein